MTHEDNDVCYICLPYHDIYIFEVFAIHAWPAGADADGHRCWKACAL